MRTSLFLCGSVLLPFVWGSCIHNTSLKPRAEGVVEISDFGYTGLLSPFNWAGLSAENVACSTATVQSPINIITANATKLTEKPVINFPSVESAEFENLGTTVETIVSGTTTLGNRTFNLAQYHLHTPSEHRIDEEYFPLEMHMVHEADDGSGDLAVIAVLFQLSADSNTELLANTIQNIDQIKEPGTLTETGPLDFAELAAHIDSSELLTYVGSLTTPPCAEGLTFIIPQTPMAIDVATFNAIKSTVKFNSRYTQNDVGQENILDLGCKAADNARLEASLIETTAAAESTAAAEATTAAAVETTAAAEHPVATTAAAVVETTTAAAVAHPTAAVSAIAAEEASSSDSSAGETSEESSGSESSDGEELHRCIMGACSRIERRRFDRRRRWFF